MLPAKKTKKLKKELKLLDVYVIGTGATLSSGFFLLPGLIALQVGPSLILSYLLAAIPLIPAMYSVIELSTAMPRAGGVYFFLDRTLGPYFGTIGGMGTWLALILKVSFALVGMGAYVMIFFPNADMRIVSVAIALVLAFLSVFGAKKSSGLQIILVVIVLFFIAALFAGSVTQINTANFSGILNADFSLLLATGGTAYVSYMGITKVASLSEEVHKPEKNLPLGTILATFTAVLIYAVGTSLLVAVVPMNELKGNLTPFATMAEKFSGTIGAGIISVIAMLAFISVANAGMLSASRYPLAMSRDHLVPRIFRQLGKFGTPVYSILITLAILIAIVVLLDPTGIAKLASAFQLLLFSFVCLGVIVMRESKIQSYDPGFKSPFYPWMQIIGIITPFIFIFQMGAMSILFSAGLILLSTLWYLLYARKRVVRSGAIFHIFERLGRQRNEGLDSELRGILKEKGLRDEDPFNEIVSRSMVVDLKTESVFENVVALVSEKLKKIIPLTSEQIKKQIMEGTLIGATPVTHGVALPHFRTDRIEHSEMVLVRCRDGIRTPLIDPLTHQVEEEKSVTAIFFLISPESNPTQHLRILAQIAGRVDDDNFTEDWENASDEQQLKEALLHDERFVSLCVETGTKAEEMIDKPLKRIYIPKGCLVAMLRRGSTVIVPGGDTMIQEGDRMTIIGSPESIADLKKYYLGNNKVK